MGAELRCQAQPQAPRSPGEGPQGCQLLLALSAHAGVSCGLGLLRLTLQLGAGRGDSFPPLRR